MSSHIMVTLFLHAKSTAARTQIFEQYLKPISDNVLNNERGTLRWCACKPYELDDGVSIYIIGEYENEAAQKTHNDAAVTKKFINDVLLRDVNSPEALLSSDSADQTVMHVDKVTTTQGDMVTFTRETINDYPEGYIVMASVEYKTSDNTTEALEGWKGIVDYCKAKEDLCLTYTVLESREDKTIRTVEAYESKTYARSVHVPGPTIKANQEQNGHMRVGAMQVKRGVKVYGFMGRVPTKLS